MSLTTTLIAISAYIIGILTGVYASYKLNKDDEIHKH